MSKRRGLGRSWFAVCLSAGFALASCTKSHDIELSEQPLTAGSSAAGSGTVAAGRGGTSAAGSGSAGRSAVGTAGRIATAGTGATGTAGRSTGTAGRAGTAGAGTAGAAATTMLSCGTCASANLFGFIMAPACCTTDNKCGLDLTSLGSAMCVEGNAPGTLDASCPAGNVMGVMLQGCCRPDGTCGSMDTYLGLGCTAATSDQKVTCTAK